MSETEYLLRQEIYRLGLKLRDITLCADEVVDVGVELVALSGVCTRCGGTGQDGDPPDAAGEGGWVGTCPCCAKKGAAPATTYEEISLDELSSRYARKHACDMREGYGGVTIEDHFQLALLYLSTGQYRVDGKVLRYRVPDWSGFTEKDIAAREANPGT